MINRLLCFIECELPHVIITKIDADYIVLLFTEKTEVSRGARN